MDNNPKVMTSDAVEDLGEALFHLSDKLRGSGFMNDDANHAEYERVVAAFQKLERMFDGPHILRQ